MDEEEKAGIFYGAVLQAWIDSRMETDRTILALSAAGLGLIVTLITALGSISDWALVAFGLGVLFFVGAVFAGLWIFHRNGPYLEKLANPTQSEAAETEMKSAERDLRRSDSALIFLFVLGIVFSACGGILAALGLR